MAQAHNKLREFYIYMNQWNSIKIKEGVTDKEIIIQVNSYPTCIKIGMY